MRTTIALLMALASLAIGCDGDGIGIVHPDADVVMVEAVGPQPAPVPPPTVPVPPPEVTPPPPPAPIPPRPAPVQPPEAPTPPPPAPVLPPPAPIPVPPEGCPCGIEKAQTCDEGLCTVFEVCSVCRE
jgi:hypothetical protein